jgi:hypothetical protein
MWIPIRYKAALSPFWRVRLYPIRKSTMPDMRDTAVLNFIARINDDKPACVVKQRAHVGIEDFIFYQVINNVETKR